MFWIDINSGKVVLEVTDSTKEHGIDYTNAIRDTIKWNKQLVTIHTHPSSMPPSIDDFNSSYNNGYVMGFVACHNGKVYAYTSRQLLSQQLYDLYVGEYIDELYDEFQAQILTLNKLKENHDIDFWEVF